MGYNVTYLEMLVVVVALKLWGQHWANSAQSRLYRYRNTTEVGITIYYIINSTKRIFTYSIEMMIRPPSQKGYNKLR